MSIIQLISLIVFALGIVIIPLADYFFFTKSFKLDFSKNINAKVGEMETSRGLKDKFAQFVDGLAEKYESVRENPNRTADEGKARQQEIRESK